MGMQAGRQAHRQRVCIEPTLYLFLFQQEYTEDKSRLWQKYMEA